MEPLTKRQKQILDYLRKFIDKHGYAPSFEETRRAFKYSSLATVHEHISNLAAKGYIRKSFRKSRAIEFCEDDYGHAVSLPLLGIVSAGMPIEAVEDEQAMPVPPEMLRAGSNCFVLKVEGDSMIDEQIRDGDYIVVASQPTANDGETVVALVGEESATVKKLYREENNKIRLQPANRKMEPIVEDADNVRVQGTVVGLIRNYR